MNNLYPIFLNIAKKVCVVVGGGSVAARKVRALLSAGAVVKVISPRFDGELAALSREDKDLILVKRVFAETDLDEADIVIAATDDRKTNRFVSDQAKSRGLWINVADDPELCNFFLPSIVTRGDLTIAVSTGGKCPALAKKIRQILESKFDRVFETLLVHLSEARAKLFQKYPDDPKKRGETMTRIVDSGIVEKAGDLTEDEIVKEINRWL